MIVVIQCAAGKREDAGYLRTRAGRKVVFVARPDLCRPAERGCVHARPDDISDAGKTWRSVLKGYNRAAGDNPLGLLPAWQLYRNPAYRLLAEHCGKRRLYILSAGWGLIRSGFLTPAYDITFSKARNVDACKRRGRNDRGWEDFSMLPPDCREPVMFLGGKDYLPLFCALTKEVGAPRLVWHNSDTKPAAPGCRVRRFRTATRTNWHYQCARAYVEGKLPVGSL